ncbi:MAG TPA: AAA family ATPase [Gemmatimonadales bacterium]|nr:AAA family ATPase [Gemmatimonadales bacterium]
MAPHLQLFTLGAPLLLAEGGEQIRFRTRKHFALLIRLATESGKKLTRDYLMDLLWPDAPADRARHSLAQALTVVKEKVGREHLQVQRATIALADDAVDADVRRLEACEAQIRGPFLDGFEVPGAVPFEQWKDEWRAKLMPRIRDCLVRQMDAGRRIGDFTAVERHAQVLLDLDPLSEDAVRGLMEARAWVGDRSNALKVYGRLEARLSEELGAKPGADLARIAGLLREGRRTPPRPAEPGRVTERHERRFEAETLIGREQEFAQLYDVWLEVRRRVPRIVVLLGDPGVGKTTLTNAFVSTCQMDGAVVARAQAYDAERELPFAVLAELVKQLTLQRAIGAADPEALSELSRVSPEIFNVFPGVPKPVEWTAEVVPLRLADSFLKAVEAATEESPLVLVVDDIHAADNASAAILHIVARKLPHTRLLVILTARSNELRTTTGPSALATDATIQALQPLDLEPLAPDAADRLVAAVTTQAEGRLADVPVARILQAGNGNPLALELLTREWLAHGSTSLLSDLEALNTQPVANVGIPRAIGAVFERQIRRLDASTRAALDLAAVLGRRLADLPLYEAVDLTPAAAGEALSRLKEEGFFREVHGSVEFRNELIRAQAYYAIAGPARQYLHRGVGAILEERAERDARHSRIELAWHFLRGDQMPRAMDHAIAGAQEALETGAPYEAEQVLQALLRGFLPTASQVQVRILLARALLDQSKAESAIPLLEELVKEAGLATRDMAEATRMYALAIYLINRPTGQSHCEAADRALVAARKTEDPELIAKALFEYARSGEAAGDENRVRAALDQTEALLQDPTAAELPVLHYAHGFCHHLLFDPRAAAASLERARQLTSTRNLTELSFIANAYGICQCHLGEFASANESFLAGLDLALKVGDDSRASVITGNLSSVLGTMGDYHEAIGFGERSLALLDRTPSRPPGLVGSFISLAEAYTMIGSSTKALECLERLADWVNEQPSWSASVAYCYQSAGIALLMRNLRLALDLIGSAEVLARGKEWCVSEPGVFAQLRIFRAGHVSSPEVAFGIAADANAKFRGRHPFYYYMVLNATAWLERWILGRCTPETEEELKAFDTPNWAGMRALHVAQGLFT